MKNKNSIAILEGKPIIVYPTEWEYIIIGKNEAKIKEAVFEIMSKTYLLEKRNKSSAGKFISFHLKVLVDSEKDRDEIFKNLSKCQEITMVI